jgi:ferrochelatase
MSRFNREPSFEHGAAPRIGVLLVNLGTPDAPTPGAVRRYLAEFLADPRVVEIPRFAWLPILHGFICARAGKIGETILDDLGQGWLAALVAQHEAAVAVAGFVGQRLKRLGLPTDLVEVELAMRYGNPGIGGAMEKLRAAGCDRILVVPLYPQYAASTTASALDAVYAHARRMRRMPALRSIDCFHDDPAYIKALAQSISDDWVKHGRPDFLVLSFHGVPRRTLDLGDPYHCHCQKTARLLAVELGLDAKQCAVAFQSRFGRARWLEPYTRDALLALAKEGKARVDVACPGFVADCLETIEEIAIESRQAFIGAGGKDLHLIPCLNEHPLWISALADLVLRHLEGWLDAPPEAGERELTALRAKALGASK